MDLNKKNMKKYYAADCICCFILRKESVDRSVAAGFSFNG